MVGAGGSPTAETRRSLLHEKIEAYARARAATWRSRSCEKKLTPRSLSVGSRSAPRETELEPLSEERECYRLCGTVEVGTAFAVVVADDELGRETEGCGWPSSGRLGAALPAAELPNTVHIASAASSAFSAGHSVPTS
jgi:hypothetical protein